MKQIQKHIDKNLTGDIYSRALSNDHTEVVNFDYYSPSDMMYYIKLRLVIICYNDWIAGCEPQSIADVGATWVCNIMILKLSNGKVFFFNISSHFPKHLCSWLEKGLARNVFNILLPRLYTFTDSCQKVLKGLWVFTLYRLCIYICCCNNQFLCKEKGGATVTFTTIYA